MNRQADEVQQLCGALITLLRQVQKHQLDEQKQNTALTPPTAAAAEAGKDDDSRKKSSNAKPEEIKALQQKLTDAGVANTLPPATTKVTPGCDTLHIDELACHKSTCCAFKSRQVRIVQLDLLEVVALTP